MDIARFFYKLYLVDKSNQPTRFLGSTFPITQNGGLLTCRHVIDISVPNNSMIAVFDSENSQFIPIRTQPVYSTNPDIDIAYIPNAFNRQKKEYFPLLTPNILKIGEDVYSFGYFAIGGNVSQVEQGYFSGKIVNFFHHEQSVNQASLTLPFPVLEGMSGSPVLTYHNGPKVVGIAIGNRNSRILASEIIEFDNERSKFKETINRIVEHGVAYHCAAINSFLVEAEINGFIMTDTRVQVSGLES